MTVAAELFEQALHARTLRACALLLWLVVGCAACKSDRTRGAQGPDPLDALTPKAERTPPPGPTPIRDGGDASTAAAPEPAARRAQPLLVAGTRLTQDEVLDRLRRVAPASAKPVGTTRTVFRLGLGGDHDAAFKAETREHPFGPWAEIASYRLARCLELDNVPPATFRSLPLALIEERLDPGAVERFAAIRSQLSVGRDGRVRGAMIYWIPDLVDSGLDRADGLAQAARWLAVPSLEGALTDEQKPFATSLSVLLGFDYLIGNFDRWSGGNTKGDSERTRLWMRDHDLAFAGRLREPLHRRIASQMTTAGRQSRRFIERVRALDRACFERELAEEPEVAALLSERQIAGLFDRRLALLSHVDALIEQHGADAVLSLP